MIVENIGTLLHMTFTGNKVMHMLILLCFINQDPHSEMLNSAKSFVNSEKNSMFSTHVYLLTQFYLCLATTMQKLLSEMDLCFILKDLLLQMMSNKIYVSSE